MIHKRLFNQEVICEMLEREVPPISQGYLALKDSASDSPIFKEDPKGPLSIWRMPDSEYSYSLGMDVGSGTGRSYTSIQVVCNETGEVVASYRSNRVSPDYAGIDAYLLGAFYQFGLLGIESNAPGLAALFVCERGKADHPQLKGYPNLYYHTHTDRRIPEEARRLGWPMNRTNKAKLLGRLAQTVNSMGLGIHSRVTLLEMRDFDMDPDENWTRSEDDIVSLALANEMRIISWKDKLVQKKECLCLTTPTSSSPKA